MRRILRVCAIVLAAFSLLLWLLLGANRGWTKTTRTRWQRDPVTEIDGPVIEKAFLPGVDFLAAGLSGALALFVASLFASKTKNKPVSSP
jgi:hypothetical protein